MEEIKKKLEEMIKDEKISGAVIVLEEPNGNTHRIGKGSRSALLGMMHDFIGDMQVKRIVQLFNKKPESTDGKA